MKIPRLLPLLVVVVSVPPIGDDTRGAGVSIVGPPDAYCALAKSSNRFTSAFVSFPDVSVVSVVCVVPVAGAGVAADVGFAENDTAGTIVDGETSLAPGMEILRVVDCPALPTLGIGRIGTDGIAPDGLAGTAATGCVDAVDPGDGGDDAIGRNAIRIARVRKRRAPYHRNREYCLRGLCYPSRARYPFETALAAPGPPARPLLSLLLPLFVAAASWL